MVDAAGPKIDVHAHYIPDFLLRATGQEMRQFGLTVEAVDQGLRVRHDEGFAYPVTDVFWNSSVMVETMKNEGLTGRIVSLAPTLFMFNRPPDVQREFISRANEFAAQLVREQPGHLWALGTVPLPQVEVSLQELARVVDLGLVGLEVPCIVGDLHLDDRLFRPFWKEVAALGLPVLLHPVYTGPKPGLQHYYFVNTIGNPYDTMLAAARLLHSGLLAELPDLKFILVHGGGFFPYQRGRFDHAWQVRTEPRRHITRPPWELASAFFYDTITHDRSALRFLVEAMGADRVLMGSDFPFDMGVPNVVGSVAAAALDHGSRTAVMGGNAVKLFGLRK